jgi:ribokinase
VAASVAVVGDSLVDVSIRPAGPIQPGADVPARVDLGPGGGGANVAVRLARAGIAVRLIAPVGVDPAGALLKGYLEAEGVELLPLAAASTGAVAILVAGDGERTMLSQRAPFPEDASRRVATAIRDAGWVHVSGYALLDARGSELATVVGGRRRAVRLAIAAPPLAASSAPALHQMVLACRPDLVFANVDEAAALLGGTRGASDAASFAAGLAADFGCSAVVTERARLAAAVPSAPPVSIGVNPGRSEVVDSTGAGDAVAASVTAALLRAAWPPSREALSAALAAAATLAGQVAAASGAQARVAAEHGAPPPSAAPASR